MEDFKKDEIKIEMLCEEMEELFKKTKEVACKYKELDFDNLAPEDFGVAFDIMKDTAESKMYITKAYKNMTEAKYYCTLTKAMEEHEDEYGKTWGEKGLVDMMGYHGRDYMGRYTSRGYDGYYSDGMTTQIPEKMYYPMPMYYPYRMDERMMYSESGMRSTGTSTSTGSGMPRQNPNEVANDIGMDSNEGNNRFYDDGNRSGRNDRMNYQESKYDRSRRGYKEAKSNSTGSMGDNKKTMERMNEYLDNLEDSFLDTVQDGSEQEKKIAKNRLMAIAQSIKIEK